MPPGACQTGCKKGSSRYNGPTLSPRLPAAATASAALAYDLVQLRWRKTRSQIGPPETGTKRGSWCCLGPRGVAEFRAENVTRRFIDALHPGLHHALPHEFDQRKHDAGQNPYPTPLGRAVNGETDSRQNVLFPVIRNVIGETTGCLVGQKRDSHVASLDQRFRRGRRHQAELAGRLVLQGDDFFVVFQHPHPRLLQFHFFPNETKETLRPRVIPQFRRHVPLVAPMQNLFARNRCVDDSLLPPQ